MRDIGDESLVNLEYQRNHAFNQGRMRLEVCLVKNIQYSISNLLQEIVIKKFFRSILNNLA